MQSTGKYDLVAIMQSKPFKQRLNSLNIVHEKWIKVLPNLWPVPATLSPSRATRIRESPSWWSDMSPEGDAFFKQLKVDLNLLLEHSMIKPIDDMKIAQPRCLTNSIIISIPIGSTQYEDEHTFGHKTMITRHGTVLLCISLSSDEYTTNVVLSPKEATCPEVLAAQQIMSLSAVKCGN